MTEGIVRINEQIAAITSWVVDNKTQRLITGMQEGRILSVLNEHELMEHKYSEPTEEDIIDCHIKVKQIIINSCCK